MGNEVHMQGPLYKTLDYYLEVIIVICILSLPYLLLCKAPRVKYLLYLSQCISLPLYPCYPSGLLLQQEPGRLQIICQHTAQLDQPHCNNKRLYSTNSSPSSILRRTVQRPFSTTCPSPTSSTIPPSYPDVKSPSTVSQASARLRISPLSTPLWPSRHGQVGT